VAKAASGCSAGKAGYVRTQTVYQMSETRLVSSDLPKSHQGHTIDQTNVPPFTHTI
jgi:hypothetical protein